MHSLCNLVPFAKNRIMDLQNPISVQRSDKIVIMHFRNIREFQGEMSSVSLRNTEKIMEFFLKK